jgi:hypothetical protein
LVMLFGIGSVLRMAAPTEVSAKGVLLSIRAVLLTNIGGVWIRVLLAISIEGVWIRVLLIRDFLVVEKALSIKITSEGKITT